jgi:hypothetical protein
MNPEAFAAAAVSTGSHGYAVQNVNSENSTEKDCLLRHAGDRPACRIGPDQLFSRALHWL